MLNVFTLDNGRLKGGMVQEEISTAAELLSLAGADRNPVWVDLQSPTPEEKDWIRERFHLVIPEDIVDEDHGADRVLRQLLVRHAERAPGVVRRHHDDHLRRLRAGHRHAGLGAL